MARAAAGCLLSLVGMALVLSLTMISSGEEDIRAEDALSLNKEMEFSAIQGILRHLDDNADGSVDLQESEEFVQMELHETTERSHKFHETDSEITSEDLWQSWQQNEVFYWTNSDVLHWLLHDVQLPQYEHVFRKHNVTGRHLPRIANNTGQILQAVLGITDSQHKQKIQLRAMDVVLFGPPNGQGSVWKDVVVVLSTSLCLAGVLYALRQRRGAQSRIDIFLDSIREKERELKALQEKLEQQKDSCEPDGGESPAKTPSPSPPTSDGEESSLPVFSRSSSADTTLTRAQEEIDQLKQQVSGLSSRLAAREAAQGLLQDLLQETCLCEREYVERRRKEAQEDISRAQKVCDKIKRRRSSMFGTFHLANSSALEEAGLQINRAVNKMQQVSLSYEEYHQRWRKIEQVCGFNIISIHHTHSQSLSSLSSSSSKYTTHLSSTYTVPHNSSSLSLQSLDAGGAEGTEGYLSYMNTSPDGSPCSSLRRRSSGESHREGETNAAFGGSTGRVVTPSLPPGGLPVRHDSYREAIDSDSLSLDSAGITFTTSSQRQSGGGGGTVSGKERGGRGGRGGKRWMFQRANSFNTFSLPAVHEERSLSKERRQEVSSETLRGREDSPAGAAGLARRREESPAGAAGLARGSMTRINSNSSHSTV